MAIDLKERIKTLLSDKSGRIKALVALGIAGIILILISETGFAGKKQEQTAVTKSSSVDYSSYIEELSDSLSEVISSIDGVGKCKVMITLKNTTESVFAKNTQNSTADSSVSQNDEYVIYDGENGDSPLLLKEKFPEIEGVAVVCSGGDDIYVKEKVVKCVSALFGVSSNRISVTKISSDY